MIMESEATKILKEKGISSSDVIKYAVTTIDPTEICKTIITKDKMGKKYALLLKGNDKIDFSKVRNIIGQKVSIVSYHDVEQSTGTEPGAVCPITLDIPVWVDNKVFQSEKINFGSGNHLLGIEMSPQDLQKVSTFQHADITR